MRRRISDFLVAMTLVLAALYAYVALRTTDSLAARIVIAIPFVLIWLVPAIYWAGDREGHTRLDDFVHAASYTSMGWLNFAVLLCLCRDALWLATYVLPLPALRTAIVANGSIFVLAGSFVALGVGMFWGLRGPGVVRIDVPIAGLHPSLEGLRIAQISDLHVGPIIRSRYSRRVVELARSLEPDLYALTGDFVDGPVERLGKHLQAFAALGADGRAFFVTGNHEYYSGAAEWIAHLNTLGIPTLQNEHVIVERDRARLMIAGVNDPMARRYGSDGAPDPKRAIAGGERADFKLLLAHNPKLAPLAAEAGFDLQLSGHTHAGQFFPWTLAVQKIHAPHVAGLTREGRMWVYVSAGTGSWGPPLRFGTRTEVTLLRLIAAK
jgi:predicted MPP superfamily phosphohydrolase